MRPVSPILTYVGIVIAAAGFVLIMFTWGKVGALTDVPLQMPYLLSGGLVGLGLVMTGLTLISVNAKRQDASARERQLGQLREVLVEIKTLLVGEQSAAVARPAGQVPIEQADPTEPIPPVTV
jgi:NADH:ubiquinone oxidoreductase subunit 6 (subunit J)